MPTQQLIPLIVIAIMLPVILLKNRKPRTLRPQWMWVLPLLITLLIGFGLWVMSRIDPAHAVFSPLDWLVMTLALVLGSVLGWQRGRMTTIMREPDGVLKAQASPIGLILLVGLVVARQAVRPWLETHAGDWHVSPVAIQDAFLLFALGLVVVQRIEMWIRARRILAGGGDAHVVTG